VRRLLLAGLALLALVAAACGGDAGARDAAEVFDGVALAAPVPAPDFTLTDTEGRPYDFASETEGHLALLFFGYTSCPDICPVHLAQLAEVLAQPGAPANATVVFATVDPARDTPEVIRRYLDRFDRRFVGLWGTEAEVAAAQEAAGVPVAIREGDGESYTVGHAGQVLAFAPNGLGYTVYPFGTRQTTFSHDLPLLAALRSVDDVPGTAG